MIIYQLHQYDALGATQHCFSHEDQDLVVKEALNRSRSNKHLYFRLEKWVNGEPTYNYRFFHNGREFTHEIIQATMDGIGT